MAAPLNPCLPNKRIKCWRAPGFRYFLVVVSIHQAKHVGVPSDVGKDTSKSLDTFYKGSGLDKQIAAIHAGKLVPVVIDGQVVDARINLHLGGDLANLQANLGLQGDHFCPKCKATKKDRWTAFHIITLSEPQSLR